MSLWSEEEIKILHDNIDKSYTFIRKKLIENDFNRTNNAIKNKIIIEKMKNTEEKLKHSNNLLKITIKLNDDTKEELSNTKEELSNIKKELSNTNEDIYYYFEENEELKESLIKNEEKYKNQIETLKKIIHNNTININKKSNNNNIKIIQILIFSFVFTIVFFSERLLITNFSEYIDKLFLNIIQNIKYIPEYINEYDF